jgi:hypothetical protein
MSAAGRDATTIDIVVSVAGRDATNIDVVMSAAGREMQQIDIVVSAAIAIGAGVSLRPSVQVTPAGEGVANAVGSE